MFQKFSLSLLFVVSIAHAEQRPNFLFIMLDDIGVGQCQFSNKEVTVEQMDPYFKELVAQKQDYTPEQALDYSKRAMPHLTRLANEGVHFTRAYSGSSLCAPARLAVATGKMPPYAGVYTNMDVESDGIKTGEHLAHRLQDAGYATAHIGKWHIGKRDFSIIRKALDRAGIEKDIYFFDLRNSHPELYNIVWEAGYYGSVVKEQNPLNNGFDYYYGYNNWASQFYDSSLVWENFEHAGRQSGYNTEVFTDKTLEFIKDQVQADQPFYVQLHYHAVHDYLEPNAPDRYWNGFRGGSYNLSNFYAHVNAIDQNVQRIVEYLESTGQLENTIIAFTSDNGAMAGGANVLPGNAPFSGHKGMFNQGGVRVPLFFWWSQGIAESVESDALVSSMDIIPTFLDAAGLEVPHDIDGKSLLGQLTGDDLEPVRDHMAWAGIHAHAWGFLQHQSLLNRNQERTKAPGGWLVVKGNYALRFVGTLQPGVYEDHPEGRAPKVQLFNYVEDPAETKDIQNKFPEVFSTMKAIYDEQAKDYGAPIAWGSVWGDEKWRELIPKKTD